MPVLNTNKMNKGVDAGGVGAFLISLIICILRGNAARETASF